MFAIGRYLIPQRTVPGELIEEFGIRSYLTEVLVLPKSALAGKPLADAGLGADLDLNVLRIVRNKDQYLLPRRNMLVEAGDVLLVEGAGDHLLAGLVLTRHGEVDLRRRPGVGAGVGQVGHHDYGQRHRGHRHRAPLGPPLRAAVVEGQQQEQGP